MTCPHFSISIRSRCNKRSGARGSAVAGAAYQSAEKLFSEYDGRLQEEDKKGVVQYHGMIRDVAGFMGDMHCIIHPTYYPEGLSNVLLEACATGRPIITTDRSGCREVVDDGVNGYMIPCQSSEELIKVVKKFIALSWNEKKQMGTEARRKVEREFNRQIVVAAYKCEVEQAQREY